MDYNIKLPSQPKVVREEDHSGMYEIDGLYPGYGHTLGNSLRRIILSSLPGAAISTVKIDGIQHEFSNIEGVKEDVVTILLNLKNVRIRMTGDEPQTMSLDVKGEQVVTAGDFEVPGQIEILNPDQVICHITNKSTKLAMEVTVEKGLGYVPRDVLHKEKVDIGTIALDAIFSPIRRVNYEVENMRVGERTDYNRLRMFIETDGTISPREVLERSIVIMIEQLKAVVGFKDEEVEEVEISEEESEEKEEVDQEFMKTRVESLGLSTRTENALINANIRTVGGLVRKSRAQLLDVEGLGDRALEEITDRLAEEGVELKD